MKGDIEFYIKLARARAMAPPGTSPTAPSYDVNKIQWQRAQGTKGPYEKTEGDNSPDYQALIKDLQAHKGKMNIEGAFYWLFENQTTIGRKVKQ